jgi:hypothetical protein
MCGWQRLRLRSINAEGCRWQVLTEMVEAGRQVSSEGDGGSAGGGG